MEQDEIENIKSHLTNSNVEINSIIEADKPKKYKTFKKDIEIIRNKKNYEIDKKQIEKFSKNVSILNQKLKEVYLYLNPSDIDNIENVAIYSNLLDLVNGLSGVLESLEIELEQKKKVSPNWLATKKLWLEELYSEVDRMDVDERFAFEQITKGENVGLQYLFLINYETSNTVLTHDDYVSMAEKDYCIAGKLYFADFDPNEISIEEFYFILSKLEYGAAHAIFLSKLKNGDYEKFETLTKQQELNSEAPNFQKEDVTITKEIAWLNELGVLSLIVDRCKDGNNYNISKAAKVLTSFLSFKEATIKSHLQALFTPNENNAKNDPLKNINNILYVEKEMTKYKLNKKNK